MPRQDHLSGSQHKERDGGNEREDARPSESDKECKDELTLEHGDERIGRRVEKCG